MSAIKDIEENLKSTYSLLSERGILGGIYLGIIIFSLLLSTSSFDASKYGIPWILLLTTILGIILSNISYELFMPMFRLISKGLVLYGANKSIGRKQFTKYTEVRNFRETFLNKDLNMHIKERIRGQEKFRITLTYLAATNITAFGFIVVSNSLLKPIPNVVYLIYIMVLFVFISTLAGILTRAWSLGIYVGLAYNEENG